MPGIMTIGQNVLYDLFNRSEDGIMCVCTYGLREYDVLHKVYSVYWVKGMGILCQL